MLIFLKFFLLVETHENKILVDCAHKSDPERSSLAAASPTGAHHRVSPGVCPLFPPS